jgi:hypothetical protein
MFRALSLLPEISGAMITAFLRFARKKHKDAIRAKCPREMERSSWRNESTARTHIEGFGVTREVPLRRAAKAVDSANNRNTWRTIGRQRTSRHARIMGTHPAHSATIVDRSVAIVIDSIPTNFNDGLGLLEA